MRMRTIVGISAATLILLGCSGPEAMLDPRGDVASRTAELWWFMAWLGGGVYLGVLVLIALGVQRSRSNGRRSRAQQRASERTARRLVLHGAVIGPALVLVVLHLVALPVGRDVAVPHGSSAAAEGELLIEVVAEKFWWRVRYPDHGFETANEVHIPTGRPVRIRLTSADVVHSFWIPRLAGKIDATPGHTTQQILRTEEPGRYRGRCTEYCGLAHAQMVVWVVAQEPQDFDLWVDRQRTPRALPEDERIEQGRQVFFGSSCVYCHDVRGHGPPNAIGPDLTYLATRDTIAAGILPNERGFLSGWIIDPQAQKPGTRMPGTQISGDDLEALLDYLQSLH